MTLISCGTDLEEAHLPLPPQWIQKSTPADWPETGIDAVEGSRIQIEWKTDNAVNLTFIVLRAERENGEQYRGEFSPITTIYGETVDTLGYVDEAVSPGIWYAYLVRVEDQSGNVAQTEDTLEYQLLIPITAATMLPAGMGGVLDSTRALSWEYPYTTEMEDYALTIVDDRRLLVWRTSFQPGQYTGGRETLIIPDSIHLNSQDRYWWRVDVQADYRNFRERKGGESQWVTFRIP